MTECVKVPMENAPVSGKVKGIIAKYGEGGFYSGYIEHQGLNKNDVAPFLPMCAIFPLICCLLLF